MRLLRSATLTVSDLSQSQALYQDYLDYRTVEVGRVPASLATAWGAEGATGARFAVLQPQSGRDIFLRFVEQPAHPDYRPLRTYGWAAIEICVTDTLAVNVRMEKSPFTIIGPPKELDGLPAIFPMQVQGPDGEIVYLTQIRDDLPMYDLPRAQSPIDCLFILVMACSDLKGALAFTQEKLGLSFGREIAIQYTMLAKAFGKPMDTKYTLATATHERDVFFEFDQYPPAATPRPCHPGMLPPGVALGGMTLPDFDARIEALADFLIAPPQAFEGPLYSGKRAATLRGPDGALYELTEA
jgi:catechol 2,3-dioxygenase-like lactoylglutathione lyase family enzyme